MSLNNNYGVTQFYGAAGNVGSGKIVGGAQDNGTLLYTPPPGSGAQGYTNMYGGDGGYCAADPTDDTILYGEYVYLELKRSVDGGASAGDISAGIADVGDDAKTNFIAPFILDPNNPNTMLAGGSSLWRSVNVKAATPQWKAIKGDGGLVDLPRSPSPGIPKDDLGRPRNGGDSFQGRPIGAPPERSRGGPHPSGRDLHSDLGKHPSEPERRLRQRLGGCVSPTPVWKTV